MPWYSAGTVAVTNNSPTVTGSGTSFSANARVGDAFRGPDGLWYEVTNVASATVISIKPNYQGATNATGSYAIAPMQGYVKDSADALRGFVNQYGAQLAGLGPLASWHPGNTLLLSGDGVRISADFSSPSGSLANRAFFQTSTVNGQTMLPIMPNGTSAISGLHLFSSTDVENSPLGVIQNNGSSILLMATATGAGAQLPLAIGAAGAERMRIAQNGEVFIGTTVSPIGNKVSGAMFSGGGLQSNMTSGTPLILGVGNVSNSIEYFYYTGGSSPVNVGSISTNGTTTSYTTSSDYRLKYNVQPLDAGEATERVMAYRPVTWTWKSDRSSGKGFIAHECQAVDPMTATGEKDSVRRVGNIRLQDYSLVAERVEEPADLSLYGEGAEWFFTEEEPVYQGRDDSKMIPDMVAMMQRHEARIAELETQLQQALALLQRA